MQIPLSTTTTLVAAALLVAAAHSAGVHASAVSAPITPLPAAPLVPAPTPATAVAQAPGANPHPHASRTLVAAGVIAAVGAATAALIYTFLGPWGLLFVAFAVGLVEIANLLRRSTDALVPGDAEVERVLEARFKEEMRQQPWAQSLLTLHRHFLGRRALEQVTKEAVEELGGEQAFCAGGEEPAGVDAVMMRLRARANAFVDVLMDKLEGASDKKEVEVKAEEEEQVVPIEYGGYTEDYPNEGEDACEDACRAPPRRPSHGHRRPSPPPPTQSPPPQDDGEKTVWGGIKRVFRSWVRKTGEILRGERSISLSRRSYQERRYGRGHGHHHGHRRPQRKTPPPRKAPPPPPPKKDDQEHTIWAGLKRVFKSWVRKTKEIFRGERSLSLSRRSDPETTSRHHLRERIRAWLDRMMARLATWRHAKFGPASRTAVHARVAKRVDKSRAKVAQRIAKVCRQVEH